MRREDVLHSHLFCLPWFTIQFLLNQMFLLFFPFILGHSKAGWESDGLFDYDIMRGKNIHYSELVCVLITCPVCILRECDAVLFCSHIASSLCWNSHLSLFIQHVDR